MPAFVYIALDDKGRKQSGTLEGDSARQVRQQIREQGWNPLDVKEAVYRKEQLHRRVQRGVRLRVADVTLVTRQLATLVRSSMPIEQALADVARQSGKNQVERVLLAVRSHVREGHSFASALEQFPTVFSDLYCKTVQAGERAGYIDVVLERLADYLETRYQIRQKTMLALFYPLVLTIVACLVIIGLVTYVVPQVVQVFDNMGQKLPWITTALIAVSAFLRDYGVWIAGILLGLALTSATMLHKPNIRMQRDRLILRLPVVGRITRGTNTAMYARTLSILTASGVPILESLRVASEILTNLPMRRSAVNAATRVREGSTLREALEKSGYFPPMMLSLIGSGESGGNLQVMLERAAEVQEQEVSTTVAVVMGLFEPLLILAMGSIVLMIVLAILLPIFDLNQLIR